MKEKITTIIIVIIWIGLGIGMLLTYQIGWDNGYEEGYLNGRDYKQSEIEEIIATKILEELDYKEWKCRQVKTCEWADWRYADPKDKCTYYDVIIMSPTNPANLPSYGAYCNLTN